MKKLLTFIIFTTILTSVLYAQAVVSESSGVLILIPNQTPSTGNSLKRGFYAGNHPLKMAEKFNDFEKAYVYYEPGSGAYAVETKVVLKKSIYQKVHFVEKELIKKVKKKNLNIIDAAARLDNVLSIGIRLINFDTFKVEQDLQKLNSLELIESYFSRIRFHEER